jgi:hypothetical protein
MSSNENMKKRKIKPDILIKYIIQESEYNNKEMINNLINDDELSRKEFESYFEVWEKSANVKDLEKIDTEEQTYPFTRLSSSNCCCTCPCT